MIFLASSTAEGDQPQLGVVDACVRRNAFGRQVDSFEADIAVEGLVGPMHAVFIRAPWIEKIGARPVVVSPAAHDRIVALASHLPQLASTALAGEVVQLKVTDYAGAARRSEPVTAGIPFPRRLVKEAADLRLVDEGGKVVPAAFTAFR